MKLNFGFFLLIIVLFFSACSLERKLAREFIKHDENKGAILVVQPFSLNMYNNDEFDFDSVAIPENFPLDSILFQRTKLLKNISDSIFLENYLNGFIQSLSKKGFQVFLPNELDAFLAVETPAYIFKFAQVELAEETYPHVIDENAFGTDVYKVVELDLVSICSWFEFEARDTVWRKVFYAEDYIMDDFEGELFMDENKNKPVLYYSLDSLLIEDVYQMANDVGKKYADYFTDFLMNNYIQKKFITGLKPSLFFHYDAEQRMLFPYYEGFEEISLPK